MKKEIEDFRKEYDERLNKVGFYYKTNDDRKIEYEKPSKTRRFISNDAIIIYFNNEGIEKIILFEYGYHYREELRTFFYKSMEELFRVLENRWKF